ncbi:MAG TPA: GNAT family N-acetyltransferase [Tenuifilaceae bacterium]|nr:GNAT family N-acetyltransferase [Tenuifilaceae bacterium]HOZ15762.1 GNAT family N-acetyltransferase [Tenuifilaceae bacterium]HPI45858.1 GNAT family N-acetyltransferase [Tenuifilaceae bacterium]HPN22518.1 GNAT family N-acetyltransferase [Tenuifilaceae bacterium]HPV56170.1 GNAT family N-acetyltransferase [Tenuifilaceae bacterium]
MDNYKIELDKSKNLIFIEVDGEIAAEMNIFFGDSDRIIIEHTLVSPKFNGKGLGKLMVAKAVEYARENGIKITPICEYAKSIFDKTPDYTDVYES